MKNLIRYSLVAGITISMAACTGGGGNGNGTLTLTHNQLARVFVDDLNATGQYDVSLAKSSTLQRNYIVIYDYDYGTYDAINIVNFYPSTDVIDYINSYSFLSYYDLDRISNSPRRFLDRSSGIVFEKIEDSSKDLETFAALAEEAVVGKRAESVASKFGLSVDRSKEVVRIAMAWQKAGGKNLTDKDQDAFSTELLGFSITEAKAAAIEAEAGSYKAMDELIEDAAITNGTSPENIRQIVDAYFVAL